jgi:type I restriction enzyme S subunit
MSLSQYHAYKDSGSQWLGKVPQHWRVTRLCYITNRIGSGKTPKGGAEAYVPNGIIFIRSQNVHDDGLRLDDVAFINEATDKEMAWSRVKPLDVLLNITGASIGRSCLVPADFKSANVNQHVCVIRLDQPEPLAKWVAWTMISAPTKNQVDVSQTGAAREGLNFEQLSKFQLCIPPSEERRKISRFLGHETTKIDTLIHEQKRLIELLQEKRQAMISHAVTKGLDPTVAMKDSGVEWLGEVPAHWGVSSLKRLVIEPLKYGANEAADDANPDHPRFVRITDVTSDGKLREETYRSLPPDVANPYLLVEGDILLARSGATVGKSFIYQDDWGNCCFAGYLIRARIDQSKAISQFVYSVLQSSNYWQYIGQEQIKATIQNVSAERYGRFFLSVPPLIEQEKILDYLNQRLEEYAGLLDISYTGIKFLKERRSALISAAVTGKIDVRDWQLPADESAFDEEVRQAGMEATV